MATLENLERIAAAHRYEMMLAGRVLERAEAALAKGLARSSQDRVDRARRRLAMAQQVVDEFERDYGSLSDPATRRRYRSLDRLIFNLRHALTSGEIRPDVAALLAKNVAGSLLKLATEIETKGAVHV